MSVNTSLVITFLGKDKPGLVDKLSSLVEGHDGNWEESHLSSMAGFFAGMVHILVTQDKAAALTQALVALEEEGLTVTVKTADQAAANEIQQQVELDVMGHDRPGIVSRISEVIAARGINVEDLATEVGSVPMSGESMFKAKARLIFPAEVSIDDLRNDLEHIADDLMVDINLA